MVRAPLPKLGLSLSQGAVQRQSGSGGGSLTWAWSATAPDRKLNGFIPCEENATGGGPSGGPQAKLETSGTEPLQAQAQGRRTGRRHSLRAPPPWDWNRVLHHLQMRSQ